MAFVYHDDVVQQVSPTTTDPTFRDPVLPWASEGSAHRRTPHLFHCGHYVIAELPVPVEQQEPVCWRVRPRLSYLLNNPGSIRIPCDVETQNPAPVVLNDEKAVQNTKRDRRDGEKVHGRDRFAMVF
ncbi:MAG: hypothetical protein WBQ72_09665 [Terriglobales bacterium]